jgi:ATP-dependent DNA ligase
MRAEFGTALHPLRAGRYFRISRVCRFLNARFAIFPNPERADGARGLTTEDLKRCRWLKPQQVAAIEFLEWTLDNHLLHPKFISLRSDKTSDEVRKEP